MPLYLDRHYIEGITKDLIEQAHASDLAIQERYPVKFLTYWFDEPRCTGNCLIVSPDKETIRKAHGEAESIVSRSWSDAEKVREEMKQKAKTEADAIVKESQRQIELETGRALRQIRSEVADLSIAIASKVIQRNVSKEDNSRLIEDTLKQIDSGRSN